MTLTLAHRQPTASISIEVGRQTIKDIVPLPVAALVAFLVVSIRAQVAIVAVASFVEVCGEIWAAVGEPCERWVRKKLSVYVDLS